MSEPIYRDANGKIRNIRKKDIRALIKRYKDPSYRRAVGETRSQAIDIMVVHELEYLLRGGRIP